MYVNTKFRYHGTTMLVINQCYMFEVCLGLSPFILKVQNKVIFALICIVSSNVYQNVCKYQMSLT